MPSSFPLFIVVSASLLYHLHQWFSGFFGMSKISWSSEIKQQRLAPRPRPPRNFLCILSSALAQSLWWTLSWKVFFCLVPFLALKLQWRFRIFISVNQEKKAGTGRRQGNYGNNRMQEEKRTRFLKSCPRPPSELQKSQWGTENTGNPGKLGQGDLLPRKPNAMRQYTRQKET